MTDTTPIGERGGQEPVAQPLPMPPGYGEQQTTLAWPTVRAKLVEAKQYWIAVDNGDRNPHVVPLDGMWIDDRWYHGGSPQTLHRRLVAKNPAVTMHLPHPWEVVIVQGTVSTAGIDDEQAARLATTFAEKYPEYGPPNAELWRDGHVLIPRKVLAWSDYPRDATRFVFG